MAKVPTFKVKTTIGPDGEHRFTPLAVELYKAYVKRFKDGDVLEWILRVPDASKTNPQLGYYHAVVKPATAEGLMEATGEEVSLEQADGFLSRIFLTIDKDTPYERVKSKADLSKKAMKDFIKQSILLIAERFGVVVPPPSEWNGQWSFEDEFQEK